MRAQGNALLVVVVILAAAAPAVGLDSQKAISQFTHTAWSAADGIPGPVRAIAQTPDGYLWLGTEAGLYRFDGLRFVAFETSGRTHPHGVAVLSLCAARDGSLWMGFGSGGVGRLHDGRVTHFAPGEGVPRGAILSIVEDRSGVIWAGGQYGLARFENGKWRRIGPETGYPGRGAQTLLVDHEGTLWVATDGWRYGLSKDPVRQNTILTLEPNAKSFAPTGEAVGMVWSMAEAPDRRVWIADTTGRRVRPIGGQEASKSAIEVGGEPMCLGFDNQESVWIGLIEGGARRVADLREPGPVVLDRFQTVDGLSGSLIYSSLKDREGNVWFGTGGGLDRFRENKVTSFSAREGLDPDQQIALTSTSDGSVWIVSYTRDAVRRYRQGRISSSKLPPYSQSDSTRILSIDVDNGGRVWVGGNFGLAREVDGKFSYVAGAHLDAGANVEAIAQDAAGDLWMTVTGVDSAVGQVLRLRNGALTDFSAKAGLPRYRCRIVHGDARGRVWFGFEDGEVAVYENGAFHIYSAKEGLPGGRVLAVTSDRSGRVWIGGEGGLSRFDRGHFQTLTKENGIPGNSVSGIVEDEDGSLWLAGALGILRVKPQELEKALATPTYRMQGMTFGGSDGLRGLPRQREPFPTATRAADGRLWFATTGGVAVIDPKNLPSNHVPPPVAIEEVNADDRTLAASSGLRLRPNTRNLAFRYSGLSLTDPERVQFRYKLEGYDEQWRGPVSAREATYTNLPPRRYKFRVIASNNDGVWNEQGAALECAIAPAFYQTSWFLLLCVASAASLGWMAYRWRVRQVRALLSLRFNERLSERTRIARELHDTLLQGFLSASMQLHVAVDRLPAESPEKPRLNRVQELMGIVIEEGRNAVRGLRTSVADFGDLEKAFARIREDLEPHEEIGFRVIGEGQARPLHAVIRDEAYWIGREALVNAFRHSGATQIEVEVEFAAKHLRILVRDDGRGIDPDLLQAGREGHWGLSNMRERAERIGAQLKVRSRAGTGTEVELSVPSGIAFQTDWKERHTGWLARLLPLRSRKAGAPGAGSRVS